MTTGIPINPNYFTGLKYNSAFYNTSGGLTLAEALTKFLAFPIAQGNETMASVIVADTLTASKNIIMNGATGVNGNYIQFPDLTKQYTATDVTDFASLNSSNIFLSELSPNQPYQQTITGNSLSSNTNAPLVIKNVDTNEYVGLYIDPAPTFDATLYSNQTNGGLTLRNVEGYSFTMTPSLPNNTALFSNPISCGTFPLTAGNITGTQLTLSSSGNTTTLTPTIAGLSIDDPLILTGGLTLTSGADTTILSTQSTGLNISDPILVSGSITLSSGGNTSVLSTSATGLNIADPIVSTGQITGNNLVVAPTGNDSYSIYSNSVGGYGLVLANITGNNGTLTLSNNSTTLTTLTSTTTGLSVNDNITVPTQTYPLTSSDQVATISYVNTAISSQGGGDASLTATQTFSGVNTFSNTVQTSALQTFPQLSTNQFATYAYVNNIGETSGFNFLKLTCPQLTSSFTITYQTQGGPLNDSGQTKYNVNTSVSGSVTTYLDTWRYCYVSQSNLSPISNCIFTLSFSTGTTPVSSSENVSIRVVNGGTQYTLPCILVNNNTQFQTTTPLTLTSSQSYAFYLQGSYI